MKYNNICVFADNYVGLRTVEHLLTNYRDILKCVVVTEEGSEVHRYLVQKTFDLVLLNKDLYKPETLENLSRLRLDYIVLAWWPYIVKKQVIAMPKVGVVNFHPSLLPYNRGKHYNFWTIVEESPFGVSLHFVNEGIDSGDVIFQKEIPKTWEDNGETLYNKARDGMIDLFIEKLPDLLDGKIFPRAQDLTKGSFHLSKEMEQASEIGLDKKYTGRELLNLLRARTFRGKPSCYFTDDGKRYCVTISIIQDICRDERGKSEDA
jgi:methionyl-tRNA formyltransferase